MPLKHYGFYLDSDVPDDQPLIAYLEPYIKPRRIGEVVRRALVNYISGGSAFTVAAAVAAARPIPTPQQPQGYLSPASASTNAAMDKAKRSFLK